MFEVSLSGYNFLLACFFLFLVVINVLEFFFLICINLLFVFIIICLNIGFNNVMYCWILTFFKAVYEVNFSSIAYCCYNLSMFLFIEFFSIYYQFIIVVSYR